LQQSLAGGQSRLAPVSRQGFAPQILAEQFIHFIRELLYGRKGKSAPCFAGSTYLAFTFLE
jgi:hypothetical protein